jgi:hypothetical protein
VATHAVSEKPYELAYEASIRAIEAQATLVESLRSRAGTMLAATALVTSFFGGQALVAAGGAPFHFVSYTTGAVASFIAASLLTLTMLLPFTLRFSLSAAEILSFVESDPRGDQLTSTKVLREVALQYESMYKSNARQLRILEVCFRLGMVFLVAEVAFWLTALTGGVL